MLVFMECVGEGRCWFSLDVFLFWRRLSEPQQSHDLSFLFSSLGKGDFKAAIWLRGDE